MRDEVLLLVLRRAGLVFMAVWRVWMERGIWRLWMAAEGILLWLFSSTMIGSVLDVLFWRLVLTFCVIVRGQLHGGGMRQAACAQA